MLVIGYGIEEDTQIPYWLLLNSWGNHWGERGFMRILRGGSKDGRGICGLASNPLQAMHGYVMDSHGNIITHQQTSSNNSNSTINDNNTQKISEQLYDRWLFYLQRCQQWFDDHWRVSSYFL